MRSARTISTSGISGAGLKKCMPTARSGRSSTDAISVTESAEVFVARIVSARTAASSARKSSCLTARSSNAASITTSQSARSASSVVSRKPADRVVARGLLERPLLDLARQEVRDAVACLLAARELDLVADVVEARLERELRDPRAHRAQADDTDDLHSFSTTPAIAMPKPTHIEAMP